MRGAGGALGYDALLQRGVSEARVRQVLRNAVEPFGPPEDDERVEVMRGSALLEEVEEVAAVVPEDDLFVATRPSLDELIDQYAAVVEEAITPVLAAVGLRTTDPSEALFDDEELLESVTAAATAALSGETVSGADFDAIERMADGMPNLRANVLTRSAGGSSLEERGSRGHVRRRVGRRVTGFERR